MGTKKSNNVIVKRFFYKKYNQSDILIFDSNYCDFNFENRKFQIIDPNKINIYYLIKIFRIKNLKYIFNINLIYWKKLIESINPKILISDNVSGLALKYKKIYPLITCVLYQHSYIYDNEIYSEVEEYKERFENTSCDFFFVFDNYYKNIFSKFIKSNYIVSGSIKNNSIILKKKNYTEKKLDILLISEYRGKNTSNESINAHKKISKIINQYCNKKNKTISIALNSTRKEKVDLKEINEISFYKRFIKNFSYSKQNSYLLANDSKIIIFISSNIGLELFSRGFRVLNVPLLEIENKKFKSPYKTDSIVSCNNCNYKEIENKLDYLINLNDKDWKLFHEKYEKKIFFDENNHIFYNKINKILYD